MRLTLIHAGGGVTVLPGQKIIDTVPERQIFGLQIIQRFFPHEKYV
jgi:hypothetical protein